MLKAKVQLVRKAKVFVISCSKDQNHHPLPNLALLTDVEKASREVSLKLISLSNTQDSLLLVTNSTILFLTPPWRFSSSI